MLKNKFFILLLCAMFAIETNCSANETTQEVKEGTVNNFTKVKYNIKIDKKDPELIKINKIEPVNREVYSKKIANDNKEYLNSKKIMDNDYYDLYRIFEKLLRANNLYYQNWRLAIKPEAEDINAYAGSANMIVIHSSLYDSLYNNDDALAFILSHELGHFLLGHHQISLENSQAIKQLETIKNNMRQEQYIENNIQRINNNTYNYYNYAGSGITSLGYTINIAACETAIKKIYEQERAMEFDADTEAISIMAKAGFDVNNANDAMTFLSNLPNIYTNRSTHPPINERISNINYIIKISDITELNNEGMQNIYNSKVLKAKKSSDNKTIVVSKPDGNIKVAYRKEGKEDKLLKKAYECYLDNDMSMSKKYFQDAFKINSKNFIPALYLSYINEYEYMQNHNKKSLQTAALWAKKASKINPNDKNITKQKQDIIEDFKELKKRKK